MKGHSERVPNKNLRPFCGKPLCHWIIHSLQKSHYVKDIVVNTDSQKIAENIHQNFNGVKIIDRPDKIRGDFVSMNTIIAHDLSQLPGEHFLQTHSTNPLLNTETIDKAIALYFRNLGTHDSLFTVTRHNARFYWGDGNPINHDPQELIRTQDLPPIFEENSSLYIFSRESFKQSGGKRIGLKPYMFEISKFEAVDIDEEDDFQLAELLCQAKLNKL
ncbi:MAG: acylneuraminate cytidylyltransferase family protein [Dehalococcoidia bacterium]|nr:acylneuraminate cytidylyltransferase family protein [Dehalococcoidia bacterium]